MRKTIIAAAAAVVLSVAGTLAAARLLFVPEQITQSDSAGEYSEEAVQTQLAKQNAAQPEDGYYLGDYEGVVAVFREENRKVPMLVFEEVYLHSLPEYDRRQLEDGIYVEDYAALSSLIEDYIS